MTIKEEEIKVGLKVRETCFSNRIFKVTKVTDKFVWLQRTPPLPYEKVFKYRKCVIMNMEK